MKDKARGYIHRDRHNFRGEKPPGNTLNVKMLGFKEHIFLPAVWFVDFGHWEQHELLSSTATKQNLDTYTDQTLYRIRNGFNIHDPSKKHEQNPSFAVALSVDGYSFSQAFDLATAAYLQGLAKRHMSALQVVDYAVVMSVLTRLLHARIIYPGFVKFLIYCSALLGPLSDRNYEAFPGQRVGQL